MIGESVSQQEVLEILQELIRTPSVNPSLAPDEAYGEEAIAKVAEQWLAANGVKGWLEEVAPGRPNTVAEVARTTGMTIPPFEPTLEGDRVYGRGSYDMKGSAPCRTALYGK